MRSTVNKSAVKSPKRRKVDLKSYALPGPPLTPEQFREMIKSAENSPTISLEEFEAQWAERKKELLKLVKK